MHEDELFEGCFITSDYNSLEQMLVGIVQNITPDRGDTPKYERNYTIFFPELNQKKEVRFGSTITKRATLIPKEEASNLLVDRVFSKRLQVQNKKIKISTIEMEIAQLETQKINIEKFLLGLSKS